MTYLVTILGLAAWLVRLSRTSIADEMREEHTRRVLGEKVGLGEP